MLCVEVEDNGALGPPARPTPGDLRLERATYFCGAVLRGEVRLQVEVPGTAMCTGRMLRNRNRVSTAAKNSPQELQMANVIKKTAVVLEDRVRRLQNATVTLDKISFNHRTEFDMKVDPIPVQVEGRIFGRSSNQPCASSRWTPLPHALTQVQVTKRGNRVEWILSPKQMFLECLQRFYERNKVLPEQVFIYCDGVFEGQFDALRLFELAARGAYTAFRDNFRPPMVLIVVQNDITSGSCQ
ncbi:protein argonaute-2-like [Tropilaelaps mercedesae]|uniref:Protein argonaute-2-like n=1 Tax=Tropilaelaps mercedesae TaxID=418985 RepID=A0A1V9XNW1_9ACAR|nr:protein argonaute-2-like [Tropilaelaps mercedesae]